MDFLSEQQLIFTSKKYEDIYIFFNETFSIKYQDLFILCSAIGFKNNRHIKFDSKGRELRSNYFSSAQKATAYSIILADKEIGREIEKFENKNFMLLARKKLEEYAEGGMEILLEEVFENKFIESKLDIVYKEYDIDLFSYVLEKFDEIPF
ncbi:hypothetical protein EV215_0316 [Hypnocyclicus thermotrophus]|uniref:Uncharacterized protein n=1 Tax=Hypnocyclicus thermotrophus TaxID=1627895 RepID=A0AA46I6L3_9FUSO|nr:hypothetical protein [Hypnocyclicus thermotrophus]TDT72506.1 hypothetical protein EV215_0316 [Hypnocyclicus thermotrophus]